jgi:FO synthase
MNLQVPPNLSAQDYPIYLNAGINDWGGISPLTIDYVNPEAPWPVIAELRRRSAEQGFELRPRLPVYPEFLAETRRFVPETLRPQVSALADAQGYVKGGIARYVGRD